MREQSCAVGSRGRPRAGRRPARGRPPNGSRPEACLKKVGWYGRPEAGLWKADFCKFALKISTFVGKLEIWKLCFLCGWTFQASHEKNIKKHPPTPTPNWILWRVVKMPRNFFFLSTSLHRGRGDFLRFSYAKREDFSGNFTILRNSFFMKKHV